MSNSAPRKVSRRGMLRAAALFAGVSALPLLAACSNQPAASPTTAPAAAPTAAAAPTTASAAAPTTASAAAPTTASAAAPTNTAAAATAATPTTAAATAATPTTAAAAAATPAGKLTAKITGNLQVIQQRGFNPLQTQYIHNLLIKVAAQNGWPMDKSYEEAFTGGGNFFEKMAAAVQSGDSPDLFFGSEDAFQLKNQGSIQALDDMVAWATQQYGNPAPLQKLGNQFDGKWYGVPFFCATGGYWVRKSWFDAINFDISKQYSMQEWLDACIKVSDASKKRWGWGNTVNRSGDGQTNTYSPLFMSGARVTTEDNKVAFNSPETIAAYDWLKDVYTNDKYKPALPPGVNAWTDPSNNEAYLAGTIGFSQNAGTMFATAMIQKPDIAADTWLALHPSGPVGQKQALIVAGPGNFEFFVFTGAKNVDAAKQLIQLLLSKENQKAVWDNSPGHSVPAYAWGWDEPELKKVPNNAIKVSQEILASDKAFKLFLPQTTPKLWINAFDSQVVATDVMADVLKGTATKDAVATGHATIQKIWDKFQGK
jgi:multiple sugar transport system substrate-binding protein